MKKILNYSSIKKVFCKENAYKLTVGVGGGLIFLVLGVWLYVAQTTPSVQGTSSLLLKRLQEMQTRDKGRHKDLEQWVAILSNEEKRNAEKEKLLAQRMQLLQKNLSETEMRIKQEGDRRLQEIAKAEEEKRKIEQEKQLAFIQTTISTTQARLEKAFEKQMKEISLAYEQKKEQLEKQRKKEFEDLTSKMVALIETQLATPISKANKEINSLKELAEKLKAMNMQDGEHLKKLTKTLTVQQKEQMGSVQKDIGGEITQDEIDNLVKQEVRKQLSSLKYRRDPRLGRLRKVVALEKMRRFIKGVSQGDEYDEDLDF